MDKIKPIEDELDDSTTAGTTKRGRGRPKRIAPITGGKDFLSGLLI